MHMRVDKYMSTRLTHILIHTKYDYNIYINM